LKFIQQLDAMEGASAVQRSEVFDHRKSFSVYFPDPYGNRLEVTTYDYEIVQAARAGRGAAL